jgi:hypothetical protein
MVSVRRVTGRAVEDITRRNKRTGNTDPQLSLLKELATLTLNFHC